MTLSSPDWITIQQFALYGITLEDHLTASADSECCNLHTHWPVSVLSYYITPAGASQVGNVFLGVIQVDGLYF